VIA
jgi:hypothetical protein